MTRGLVEYRLDGEPGETVFVEVDDPVVEGSGEERAAFLSWKKPAVAQESLDNALERSMPAARAWAGKLRSLVDAPDELTIEFGIKLTASAGAVLASAAVEANYTVTMMWKGPTERRGPRRVTARAGTRVARERAGVRFTRSLVRLRGGGGDVVGAGFFVESSVVCTCAHVVAAALGLPEDVQERPAGEVHLDVYEDGSKLVAEVVEGGWVPARAGEDDGSGELVDLALLRIVGQGDPRSGMPARLLMPGPRVGHPFSALGFAGGEPAGVWAHGETRERRANGSVQLLSKGGVRIQPGFSGAPVWDAQERAVVGMVVSSWREAAALTAFIIPIDKLAQLTGWTVTAGDVIEPSAVLTGGPPTRGAVAAFLDHYLGTAERPVPFGGRDVELANLDAWLDGAGRPYRLLVAPAGRGKSALLAHWATRAEATGRADVAFVPSACGSVPANGSR